MADEILTLGNDIKTLEQDLARNVEDIVLDIEAVATDLRNTEVELAASIAGAEDSFVKLEKRVNNIENHISGEFFTTDNSTAYIKTVPSKACSYAQLNNISGMTYKCENLLKIVPPNNNPWVQDSAICSLENGVLTLDNNGVMTKDVTFTFETEIELVAGESYWVSSGQSNTSNTTWRMYIAPTVSGAFTSKYTITDVGVSLGTISKNTGCKIYIQVYAGTQPKNIVFVPTVSLQSVSSTGTPYFEGLRDAKVSKIISRGKNRIPFPYYNTALKSSGVNFATQSDRGVKATGTAESYAGFTLVHASEFEKLHLIDGETYYLSGKKNNAELYFSYKDETGATIYVGNGQPIVWNKNYRFTQLYIQVNPGKTVDDVVYPVLSLEKGADYVPYWQMEYEIPEELQHTGKGVSDRYDTTEYGERSEFNGNLITQVATTVFNGTETFVIYDELVNPSITSLDKRYFCYVVGDPGPVSIHKRKIICNILETSNISIANTTKGITITNPSASGSKYAMISRPYNIASLPQRKNTSDNSFVNAFKADLSRLYSAGRPMVATYALETESEQTSRYGFDNLIQVEADGQLEFYNEYGYAVPSSVTYMLKEETL